MIAEQYVTLQQDNWLRALRRFRPDAQIEAEVEDDGAMVVTMTEDGAVSSCWVGPDGEIIGNWL